MYPCKVNYKFSQEDQLYDQLTKRWWLDDHNLQPLQIRRSVKTSLTLLFFNSCVICLKFQRSNKEILEVAENIDTALIF